MGEVLTQRQESDAEKIYKWRLCWLLGEGFTLDGARELADNNKVDVRYAIKVLASAKAKGYDEKFVINLIT